MIGNFWIPEKVSGLGDDKKNFEYDLTSDEQRAYKWILSFLIFLDSIQTVNLPNFSEYITAPEVNLLLAIQAYQEAIHSQSYATILESVVDSKDRDEIYYFWREDKHLLERNTFIGQIYQNFIDHPNNETLFAGLVGNFILESIYFYNGFAFFDTLVDHMKMPATGKMIAYIRRDELTHVTLFANILKEIKKEFPAIWNTGVVEEMMRKAVEQEIAWSNHILGNKIMWINKTTTDAYTKWLANGRLAMLWLPALYPEAVDNPYKHLERIQDANSEKANFFESTVVNYTQSSSMKGSWDF